jgi:two-component system response regulator AtoC
MREVLDLVSRVAPSDANVLLTGESGVGKEVVARTIHQLSPRRTHELVPINCATLSGDTLENELFGHEKGAFTSADERKLGVFELAHGGTLFLDEVNEMGLACQAKVLRALERREFRRLGGTRKIKVDVRLVAATNVDLDEAVRTRRFREDLFYRLNVIHIHIPPLRDRREAIAPLAQQFLREFSEKYGNRRRLFSEEALMRLMHYPWPGNVRELRNVVESLVLVTKGELIGVRDLPANIRAAPTSAEIRLPIGVTLQEAEKEILRCYLEVFPTKKEVARVLNIGLRTLHAKIKAYGLLTRHRRSPALHSAKIAV